MMINDEVELTQKSLPQWTWILLGFAAAWIGFLSAVKVSELLWSKENKTQRTRIHSDKGTKKPANKRATVNLAASDAKSFQVKKPKSSRIAEVKVATLLAEAGFPDHTIPKMVCTARFESAFDTRAKNENRNGSVDIGLFQINEIWHEVCGMTKKQLLDPTNNIECAKKVFDESGYWAWYGYRKNQATCRRYEVQMRPTEKREKLNLAVR